jgi:hypothetical protein
MNECLEELEALVEHFYIYNVDTYTYNFHMNQQVFNGVITI